MNIALLYDISPELIIQGVAYMFVLKCWFFPFPSLWKENFCY